MAKKEPAFSGYMYMYRTDDGSDRVLFLDKKGVPFEGGTCKDIDWKDYDPESDITVVYSVGKIKPRPGQRVITEMLSRITIPEPSPTYDLKTMKPTGKTIIQKPAQTIGNLLKMPGTKHWEALFESVKQQNREKVAAFSHRVN